MHIFVILSSVYHNVIIWICSFLLGIPTDWSPCHAMPFLSSIVRFITVDRETNTGVDLSKIIGENQNIGEGAKGGNNWWKHGRFSINGARLARARAAIRSLRLWRQIRWILVMNCLSLRYRDCEAKRFSAVPDLFSANLGLFISSGYLSITIYKQSAFRWFLLECIFF